MAGNGGSSLFFLFFLVDASISLAFLLDFEGASDLDRSLYHSPAFLARDYQEFLDRFKVYVYPMIQNASAPDLRDGKAARPGSIDRVFVDSLLASGFVTDDPEAADLFLLPASISAIWKKRPDPKGIAHSLKSYIQQLRDLYPYWQRSLGADHFFVSCHDITSDWSRNVLELKKNAIQIACFPLARHGAQEFLAHKDITMPPAGGSIDPPQRRRWNLAVYDSSSQGYAARDVPASWKSDESFVAGAVALDLQLLVTTRFCLSLGSSDRHLVIPAVRSGCIPVIFSAGKLSDLPFQDILDWNSFAIVLSRDQLHQTKGILESIDEEKRSRLQENGARAAKHMEWHSPPQPEDAFYMVLYQLWRRRHVSRYVD
ncbi:probable glycosyltransferase At5g20260 [Selaginella moellendorffii]|uniref:probable glycosyltransferase At5g20260 n=1 Tax=Selaginella moellendorffii TaxID=88036 RepID=UPI000D1CE120|nr:probable glycosyltransferase At5g20260 [Selaginella moellendorffii]|eukprot:XP_024544526.1 probable glycosyltransferase At5g20260 [Selaginella moellendorffii]